MKTRCVIYARYSPRPNAPTATIEMQLEKCRHFAAAKDWEVVAEFKDEGISGATANRPGFQSAIKECLDYKAVFLVYNLSRFARNLKVMTSTHERLTNGGCDLASVMETIDTTTASGKLMLNIQGAFNQFFRDQVSETTSAALRSMDAAGKRVSSMAPYGYEYIDDLKVEHSGEQETIRVAKGLFDSGLSLQKAADELNRQGFRSRGGPWTRNSIRRLKATCYRQVTDDSNGSTPQSSSHQC